MERKEIVCEECGVIYFAEDIPAGLECTCHCKNFKIAEPAVSA